MTKAAVVVLAGTESISDMGRVVNAMEAVKEFEENDDDVKLIFDGSGTQWIGELEDPEHDYYELYRSVKDTISVCDYCVSAFQVDEEVEKAGVPRKDEYEGHPSIRTLTNQGYNIITF